jgi:transposase
MKKYATICGIDVSKNSLDICMIHTDHPKEKQYQVICNDEKSIQSFLKTIVKEEVLFCMEDTGVYSMPLCYQLDDQTLDYAVIPAIHIKKSKGLHRGKTDKSDAKDIANYALTHLHQITLHHLPEENLQELKLLLSDRDKLISAIKTFESSQESLSFIKQKIGKSTQKHNLKTTAYLKKQLANLEKLIEELIEKNETMNKQMKLLQSIPGIGPQTSLLLISYTRGFTSFKNWRQLACYCGIAPFEYQSGKSIKGKTKVSHFAQKRLKAAIHLAAITSKKYDGEMNKYFERKITEGKNKMLVINAVRCKLIARAFAVVNRGTPFVNIQKFVA